MTRRPRNPNRRRRSAAWSPSRRLRLQRRPRDLVVTAAAPVPLAAVERHHRDRRVARISDPPSPSPEERRNPRSVEPVHPPPLNARHRPSSSLPSTREHIHEIPASPSTRQYHPPPAKRRPSPEPSVPEPPPPSPSPHQRHLTAASAPARPVACVAAAWSPVSARVAGSHPNPKPGSVDLVYREPSR